MAILHEYTPTSEKEGYYIYDAYEGSNVTYQVSPVASAVFEQLNSCTVDEQIPSEVFSILHQLEFIYTHESGVEREGSLETILSDNEGTSLSDTAWEIIFTKVLSTAALSRDQRQEIKRHIDETDLVVDPATNLHTDWVPYPPDQESSAGEVKITFDGGAWGFIESEVMTGDDDIFFHTNELDQMTLHPGMEVDFTAKETDQGYQAEQVRRRTDSLGQTLPDVESDPAAAEPDTGSGATTTRAGVSDTPKTTKYSIDRSSANNKTADSTDSLKSETTASSPPTSTTNPEASSTSGGDERVFELPREGKQVGLNWLSEGDYVETLVHHRNNGRGYGPDGHLHIHHDIAPETKDGYQHISTRDERLEKRPEAGTWVTVRVVEVHTGHTDAIIESPPSDAQPPLYVP